MKQDDRQILDGAPVNRGSARSSDGVTAEHAIRWESFDADADVVPDFDLDVDADEELTAAVVTLGNKSSRDPGTRPVAGRKATFAAIAISVSLHSLILSAAVFATIAVRRAAEQVRHDEGDGAVVTDVMSPRTEEPIPEETALPAADLVAAPQPVDPAPRPNPPESPDVPELPAPQPPSPTPTLASFAEPADVLAPRLGMTTSSADVLPKLPRRSPPVPTTAATPAAGPAAAAPPAPPTVTTLPKVAKAAGGRTGRRSGLDDRGLPIPDYPAESRRRREQGLVELDVEVLPDGRVGAVKTVTDPGFPRLVEAAIAAVKRGAFEAATADGKAVAGHLIVPFRFVLH